MAPLRSDARQQQGRARGGESQRELLQRDRTGCVDRVDPVEVEHDEARSGGKGLDLRAEALGAAEEERALELDDGDLSPRVGECARFVGAVDAPRRPRRAVLYGAHQRAVHRRDEQRHRQEHAGDHRDHEVDQHGDRGHEHDHGRAPEQRPVAVPRHEAPDETPGPHVHQTPRDGQHDPAQHRERQVSQRIAAGEQDCGEQRRRDDSRSRAFARPPGTQESLASATSATGMPAKSADTMFPTPWATNSRLPAMPDARRDVDGRGGKQAVERADDRDHRCRCGESRKVIGKRGRSGQIDHVLPRAVGQGEPARDGADHRTRGAISDGGA